MEANLPNTERINIYSVAWAHKGYWFDKKTMQSFKSRVATFALLHDGKAYFTSSEQSSAKSPRLYTIRVCTIETGKINRIGEFQEFKTAAAARKQIHRIIKNKEGVKQMTNRLEQVTCHECGIEGNIEDMYAYEVYKTPWDNVPETIYAHKIIPAEVKETNRYLQHAESCEDLLTDTSWADFSYYNCAICGRMICRQNPQNGWHSQVRIINECEEVCLQCYETMILEDGMPIESFEDGVVPGMFFSDDNHEPLDADYQVDSAIDCLFITSGKAVCNAAIAHIKQGHKVVIGYERMAMGGIEGSVSLFYK